VFTFVLFFFFFFQAEDGIRDRDVTGVQTCALPILHALSTRATKPLVVVNMGGLSEGVFESELFGHVKGAFTDAKTDRVGRFELRSEERRVGKECRYRWCT